MLAMLAVVLCARDARAQDDWQVIERHTTSQAPAAAGVAATRAAALTCAGTYGSPSCAIPCRVLGTYAFRIRKGCQRLWVPQTRD